jgi:hypothetical protein
MTTMNTEFPPLEGPNLRRRGVPATPPVPQEKETEEEIQIDYARIGWVVLTLASIICSIYCLYVIYAQHPDAGVTEDILVVSFYIQSPHGNTRETVTHIPMKTIFDLYAIDNEPMQIGS